MKVLGHHKPAIQLQFSSAFILQLHRRENHHSSKWYSAHTYIQHHSSKWYSYQLVFVFVCDQASLQQKQRQLHSQQEDARELKENLDRRESIVLHFLGSYLSTAQLHDYRRYIRAKPALLIRQRHLDELIRQGEEQVCRLTENTNHELNSQTGSTPSSCSDSNLSNPTTVTSLWLSDRLESCWEENT